MSVAQDGGRASRVWWCLGPGRAQLLGVCATNADITLSHLGDGDIVNNMYEPDPDLLAGQSAEEETEDSILSPIPMGPPSPFPTSEDFTPKEGSPYEAPVYIPEDIPVPPDFELRESSIPGAGLGIWARRKMEAGERFGPYVLAPRAALKEADFGWEVSMIDHGHLSCVQSIYKAG